VKEYKRGTPFFSLCGLNCGLCPRFQTAGESRCPGCGGQDFHVKHPSCSVITCSKKHGCVEYCFECSSYPCDRYRTIGTADSFISYRNVLSDMERANADLNQYTTDLNAKMEILGFLLSRYDDGRRKSFYCVAVNLLELRDLKDVLYQIEEKIDKAGIPFKEQIEQITALLKAKAGKAGIELKLRK
jgi:hypothetical protein